MSILSRMAQKLRSGRDRQKRIEKKLDQALEILDPTGFHRSGERQVTACLDKIRGDHLGRYQFAAGYVKSGNHILDMACGIGYGSFLLASKQPDARIVGVDLSKEAVDYAHRFYELDNCEFMHGDGLSVGLDEASFDGAVSFETIEHVNQDREFIQRFFSLLKPGAWFICSVPNETVIPFKPERNPFHVRHYKESEMRGLLEGCGFVVKEVYSQFDKYSTDVSRGGGGQFLLFVCEKN